MVCVSSIHICIVDHGIHIDRSLTMRFGVHDEISLILFDNCIHRHVQLIHVDEMPPVVGVRAMR